MTTAKNHENLTQLIRQVRSEWFSNGKADSGYEINSGNCYHFAKEVFDRAPKEWNLKIMGGDRKNADPDVLLSQYKPKDFPKGITEKDIHEHSLYKGHSWLVMDDKHFDSECSTGTQSFLEIPCFARGVQYIQSSNGIKIDPIKTDDISDPKEIRGQYFLKNIAKGEIPFSELKPYKEILNEFIPQIYEKISASVSFFGQPSEELSETIKL